MIELTLRSNYDKVIVSNKHIIWMFPHDKGTTVYITGDMSFDVIENITEINKKLAKVY